MIIKSLQLLLAIIFFYSASSYANFYRAMELYQSGDYEKAKVAFEALSAIGDRASLFNLGVMYYRGDSIPREPVKAYVLMTLANEGIEDEQFSKVSESVYNQFDQSQKDQAAALYQKLAPVYDFKLIQEELYPKPLADEDCKPDIEPTKKNPPKYPVSELNSGQMGLTQIELTISPEGYPRDLITNQSTNRAFTKSTITAAKKFLYEPTKDGMPIHGQRVIFTYAIQESKGEKVKIRTKKLTSELNELSENASKGDPIAQYHYATRLNTYRYFREYLKKVDLQYKKANEWFLKSAKGGLPHAQFELGRNMMTGRGCEVDLTNGQKWINAAAANGYSPAQRTLAMSSLSDSQLTENRATTAVSWLKNAVQSNDYMAKVLLAWELSTSENMNIRNPSEALALISEKPENYFDEVRILETKAAAYASLGDFKKAIKLQKKAIKEAKKLDWNIPLIPQRLALYEQNKGYQGSYY